jgi:hypothetical protein
MSDGEKTGRKHRASTRCLRSWHGHLTAAAAGFTVARAPKNLGHLASRMTFLARKVEAAPAAA